MGYNRANGGDAGATFVESQYGKGYSEQSPPHSEGDGHLWDLGEPLPGVYDCSGLAFVTSLLMGCPISRGSADQQWRERLGGFVPIQAIKRGDFAAFMGVNNIHGYAGHIGIVTAFNPATMTGTLGNAYDTAQGVCPITFSPLQLTNGGNGLGWVGAFRPANSLPPAPVVPVPNPAQEEEKMFISLNDAHTGDFVVHASRKMSIPSPAALAAVKAQGIPEKDFPPAQLDTLVQVPWGTF